MEKVSILGRLQDLTIAELKEIAKGIFLTSFSQAGGSTRRGGVERVKFRLEHEAVAAKERSYLAVNLANLEAIYSILSLFWRLCLPQSNWILSGVFDEPPFEKGII